MIKEITPLEIIDIICDYYGTSYEEINCRDRSEELRWPRQVCMYFLSEFTTLSLNRIGKYFGRDHATIIHSRKKISDLCEIYPNERERIAEIRGSIIASREIKRKIDIQYDLMEIYGKVITA